jgi:hypothetical protein
VNECGVVYRLPIAERWLEVNTFGDVTRLFVKSMAQPVDNADHFDLTAGEETYLQCYFPWTRASCASEV